MASREMGHLPFYKFQERHDLLLANRLPAGGTVIEDRLRDGTLPRRSDEVEVRVEPDG